MAPKILSLLLPVLSGMTNETLYLVLETINSVVSLDKSALTAESTNAICEHVYSEWLNNTTGELPLSLYIANTRPNLHCHHRGAR